MKNNEKVKKLNKKVAMDDYIADAQFFFDYECKHDCVVTENQYYHSTDDSGHTVANGGAIRLCPGSYDSSCEQTSTPSGWSAW